MAITRYPSTCPPFDNMLGSDRLVDHMYIPNMGIVETLTTESPAVRPAMSNPPINGGEQSTPLVETASGTSDVIVGESSTFTLT